MLAVSGSLVLLVFLVQTVIAMFQRGTGWVQFWSWAAAAETAAWRLKWVSIPVLFATIWFGQKLYRSIRLQPGKFCGLQYARHGLIASSFVAMLIALLIGITVPARLRHRQWAADAAIRANWYTFERAAFEYRLRYHTYPADFKDLRDRIPDPDGSLAEALASLDPTGYRPSADVASVTSEKSRSLRGAAIRKVSSVSSATDDTPAGGLAFTRFELRMPGEDKILGTEDDWIGRNGILRRITDDAKGEVGRSVSAGVLQP